MTKHVGLLTRLFHRHDWQLVSGNVSSRLGGFAVTLTLECDICGKRQCFMKGHGYLEDQFPSKSAAKVWAESLLPPGHPGLNLTDRQLVNEE